MQREAFLHISQGGDSLNLQILEGGGVPTYLLAAGGGKSLDSGTYLPPGRETPPP